MAEPFLIPEDLAPFATIDGAKAEAMIEDATAMAIGVAPCIADSTDPQVRAQVKAVLRAAILRWNDAGSGALVTKQDTTGPFSHQETYDTRTHRSGLFWPDEITTLQGLCKSATKRAFSIDTTPQAARDKLEALNGDDTN
jgi:hypothetical protein